MLFSHPNYELSSHLLGVTNQAFRFMGDVLLEDLKINVAIVCLLHDFAKATKHFQTRLQKNIRIKNGELGHSLLSSIIAFKLTEEYYQYDKTKQIYAYINMFAINHHHGNVSNFYELFTKIETNIDKLKEQLEDIDYDELNKCYTIVNSAMASHNLNLSIMPFDKQDLLNYVSKFKRDVMLPSKIKQLNNNLALYIRFSYIYSLLISSDKLQAAFKEDVDLFNPSSLFDISDIMDTFKQQYSNNNNIDKVRNEAYDEIALKLHNITNEHIFSLNLPTGIGKTNSVLNFAFKLREQRRVERGVAPKIIFALPFTTITDQVFSVLTKTLEKSNISTNTDNLLKNHYLSDIDYLSDNVDENYWNAQSKYLDVKLIMDNWLSNIVVTTFMQIFNTMIGFRNKTLAKFHQLNNAIIILDEVQSIPIKYWNLVRKVINSIKDILNVDFIFVTATQPKIFDDKEVMQLTDIPKYYAMLNRINMYLDLKEQTVEEFIDAFSIKYHNCNKRKLIIFNTISSTQLAYYHLEQNGFDMTKVAVLSTALTPFDRMNIINNIKNYNIVLSTQLIEAGVDVDFDIVYRDFAPIDSINQSAGRCNRNGISSCKGEVYVIKLSKEAKKREDCDYIYDKTNLEITLDILEKHIKTSGSNLVTENQFLILVNEYFKEAKLRKHLDIKVLDAMCNLEFQKAKNNICDFQLIEALPRISIFIAQNSEAIKIYNQLIATKKLRGLDRKNNLLQLNADISKYVIQSNINVSKYGVEQEELYYVPQTEVNKYYDKLGFNKEKFISDKFI